jgi:hypothetical protein
MQKPNEASVRESGQELDSTDDRARVEIEKCAHPRSAASDSQAGSSQPEPHYIASVGSSIFAEHDTSAGRGESSALGEVSAPRASETRPGRAKAVPAEDLEVIRDSDDYTLKMLELRGNKAMIDQVIENENGNCRYGVPKIYSTFDRSLPLPSHPVPYGTTQELFDSINAAFKRYALISERSSLLATYWTFMSWMVDRLPLGACLSNHIIGVDPA